MSVQLWVLMTLLVAQAVSSFSIISSSSAAVPARATFRSSWVLRDTNVDTSLEYNAQEADSGRDKLSPHGNFTANLGHCMETLREDLPLLFELPQEMDIFTSDVVLKDPKGTLSKGKRLYGAIFTSLRVLSTITGLHPRVDLQSLSYNEPRKFVEARLEMSFGPALIGDPVKLTALTHYKLNDDGIVREVEFDNILKRQLWEYSTAWGSVADSSSGSSSSNFGKSRMQHNTRQPAFAYNQVQAEAGRTDRQQQQHLE